jgi:biopolymer transport protein ExbB/TolQ
MTGNNKTDNWLLRNFPSVLACLFSLISLVFVYFRVDMICDTEMFLSLVIALVAVIVAFQALFQIYNSIHYRRDISRAQGTIRTVKNLKGKINELSNKVTNDIEKPLNDKMESIKKQLEQYKEDIEKQLKQKADKEVERVARGFNVENMLEYLKKHERTIPDF